MFLTDLAVENIQRPHLSVRPLNGREKRERKENERDLPRRGGLTPHRALS